MFIEDMPSGYRSVLDYVVNVGERAVTRGMAHLEVLGFQLRISRPERSLATNVGRKLNDKIAFVEALQLISGESYPELINKVSGGSFKRFMDGQVLHGAYGPRLRPQMLNLLSRLERRDTRQGVVTIWDPMYDQSDRRDLPCTLGFQFLPRDGELHMVVTMRSNDAWLGLPYDVFQFSQLQCTLASCLEMVPGTYVHNVGSMHLYEEHLPLVEGVISRTASVEDEYWGMTWTRDWEAGSSADNWELAQHDADVILRGDMTTGIWLPDGLPRRAWDKLNA